LKTVKPPSKGKKKERGRGGCPEERARKKLKKKRENVEEKGLLGAKTWFVKVLVRTEDVERGTRKGRKE